MSWWVAVSTTVVINSLVTYRALEVRSGPGQGRWRLWRDRHLLQEATQALGGLVSLGTFLALLPLLRPLLSLATLAATSCNDLGARSVPARAAMAKGWRGPTG